MIELAPRHKIGLPLTGPLMPAAGFFGYTHAAYRPLIQGELLGALVTNPITLRPRRHRTPPQIIETGGGVIFSSPPANPGVKRVIRQYQSAWRRAPGPIIAHLPADDPPNLARTVGALDGLDLIAGFEVGLEQDAGPDEAQDLIAAVLYRSELPLLVNLPFPPSYPVAEAVIEAGASGLVASASPWAAAYAPPRGYTGGRFYGGGLAAQLLPHLVELRDAFPDISLVAGGGVHSRADVEAYLQAGAGAVQIDSLIFIEPAQVQHLLLDFAGREK